MAELEVLRVDGADPVTATGQIGLVMLRVSGQGEETQWFDYKPSYYGDTIRVEWDKDTMAAVIPPDVAGILVRQGYARVMTQAEAKAYNLRVTEGEQDDQGPVQRSVQANDRTGNGDTTVLPVSSGGSVKGTG